MHIINKMAQHQQRKIQKSTSKQAAPAVFCNQLTSPELLATVDNLSTGTSRTLLPQPKRYRCF